MKRKWFLWILILALCMSVYPIGVQAQEEEKEDLTPYIQQLIQYYRHHGSEADREIETVLSYIKKQEPAKGQMWENIMTDWAWCNEKMKISEGEIPDGLAQDDSLCIVVLGYQLNSDGSMAKELVGRMNVALKSAKKYPNAYIAVSGGGTAADKTVTEAGQMAAWLKGQGIAADRIIVENQSYSTDQNAVNVYKLLKKNYPTVSQVAVVSSDYHLPWGCAMFTTLEHYNRFRGDRVIEFVGNGGYMTGATADTAYSQAWGISVITYTPYEEKPAPALVVREENLVSGPVQIQEETTAAAEPVTGSPEDPQAPEADLAEPEEEKRPWWWILPVGIAALILVREGGEAIRRKKRRARRQRKKMDL